MFQNKIIFWCVNLSVVIPVIQCDIDITSSTRHDISIDPSLLNLHAANRAGKSCAIWCECSIYLMRYWQACVALADRPMNRQTPFTQARFPSKRNALKRQPMGINGRSKQPIIEAANQTFALLAAFVYATHASHATQSIALVRCVRCVWMETGLHYGSIQCNEYCRYWSTIDGKTHCFSLALMSSNFLFE